MLCALVALAPLAACGADPITPTPPVTPPPVTNPPDDPPPPPPPVDPPRLRYTRILAFGNSMTEGDATPDADPTGPGNPKGYPHKLRALLTERYSAQTIQVFNGGYGGERAANALPHLRDMLRQTLPEVMILFHGENDLIGNVPIGQIMGSIEELIQEARGRGVIVLLSTIPIQNPNGTKRLSTTHLVEPFNRELAKLAPDEGAILVDVYPFVPIELVAPDGLHLTQEGNQRLAEVYLDKLKSLYEIPAATTARIARK
jgi:lysophospholipase L1-like esterase